MVDIGWDILGNYHVLIDRYSQKMAIFTYDTAPDCLDIGTLMKDPGPFIPWFRSMMSLPSSIR